MATDPSEDVLFEAPGGGGRPAEAKVPAGKAKTFRHYDPTQSFLLPPSLDDWLPEEHTARFVAEAVDEMLDLSSIYDSYVEASGAPPYDPKMMLKLLLFAYSTGVTSSREMERRCQVDVAFRWLSANAAPDYRSISRFRRRHLVALDDLFIQVLTLCASSGLVSLGRVALDGTKLRASASRHKAMSYDRLGPRIDEISRQVADILAEAEAVDAAEDAEFGEDRRGDELPAELATREGRLARMRAAKEAIEAEAAEKAAAQAAQKAADGGGDESAITEAAEAAAAKATPSKRAQRNFTDPESRMMKTNAGFHYAYNAQTVVDEGSQVVVAAEVTNQAADVGALTHMIAVTEGNLDAAAIDASPDLLLADAGYCSEANLQWISETESNILVATGRIKDGERVPDSPRGRIPKNATQRERMARKLRTKQGRIDYARRKAIVEPAFGQMKVRQAAGQLRLRGLAGAQGEWTLHVICHNLRKLANATQGAPVGAC
jgi:transposase